MTLLQYFADKYLFNCLSHLCYKTDNMSLYTGPGRVGLLHLVQQRGGYSGVPTRPDGPVLVVPNVTDHPSRVSVPISVWLSAKVRLYNSNSA